MKHTYKIEVRNTDGTLDDEWGISYERFHNMQEAQNFVNTLNSTDTFKHYGITARITREII